jgi:hypothetical protein
MTNPRRLALVSLLALALLLAWRLEWVREPELLLAVGDQAPVAVVRLRDGRFEHVFTHSVHKTPVRELFQVEVKGDAALLHLYELRYQSQGVGMPADAEGGYRLEGNTFVLTMDRSFPELQIMVSPVAGHGIVARGAFLPFINYKQPGQRLVLSARMTRHIRLRR